MIKKEDIEHVARIMRIEIDDVEQYFEQTQKILRFFDHLDEADTDSEELIAHEIQINELREDTHIPFDSKLIEHLKNYKGRYVRAPKMS